MNRALGRMWARASCEVEFPVVAAADQPFTFNVAVGEPAAVVRADIVDDKQSAAGAAHHRNVTFAIARGNHCAARQLRSGAA